MFVMPGEGRVLQTGGYRGGMMEIIYKPTGAALEYAPLAANLLTGCPYRCRYCFGPGTLKRTREDFHSNYLPKPHALAKLAKNAHKLGGMIPDKREILLSFVGDVYLPEEENWGCTREAIKILIANGLTFTLLTKGGMRAVRDFDLLAGYPKARFGSTIVFSDQESASKWEPGAPDILDRMKAIKIAHEMGILTWVSLEPVIYPAQALDLMRELNPIVDHWKIGKLNRMKTPEPVDWVKFRADAKLLLDSLGADYYFKTSLPAPADAGITRRAQK
jgi:DNA repair photolyase